MNDKDRGFYAGIITALAIVDLHGEDTIYDEIMETMNEESRSELVSHAIENDELEFSGLRRHGYAATNRVKVTPQEKRS